MKTNLFVSWNKWVDKALNNEFVKGYILNQLSNNMNDKTACYLLIDV